MESKNDNVNPYDDRDGNNQNWNNNINTPWWSEDGSFYTTRSVANGFRNNRISSGEDETSNNIHSNETDLFNSSTTLSWSEEVSVYSTDRTESPCVYEPNHPVPMEIQFSGLGDYGPGSYMYAMLFAVATVGILGNILVLLVLCKNRFASSTDASSQANGAKDKGSVVETLLINQSVADLLTSVLLLIASNVQVPEHFAAINFFTEFICRIFRTQMPLSICFTSSVYNLVAIALEQYVQVVHPIFYHTKARRVSARVYIATVWAISICCNIVFTIPVSGIVVVYGDSNDDDDIDDADDVTPLPIFVCSEYDYNLDLLSLHAMGVLIGVVYYFLPACIIVYTLCHIVVKLQRKRYQVGPLGQMSVFRSVKVAVLKSMALFCCVFIVCWSLNSAIHTLAYFGVFSDDFFVSPFYASAIIMFYGCCAINPLLYAVRYRKFKDTLKSLCPLCKRSSGSSSSGNRIGVSITLELH